MMRETAKKMNETRKRPSREPRECLGLKIYPIFMSDYDTFCVCKGSLLVRQSKLPFQYMIKNYLSALLAMELDSIQNNSVSLGLFDRLMILTSLSLRIVYDRRDFIERSLKLTCKDGAVEVESITFEQDGKSVTITPREFSAQIRPMIAEINGLKLPNESDNAELLDAHEERMKMLSSKVNLNRNTEDLIATVAYLSHITEDDIMNWTVREFENRMRAIERERKFMMYGQAEMSGMVKFKDGNPVPSLFFDVADDSIGTTKLSELQLPGATNIQSS